ncbi:hypothetical protein T492DRAFT_994141 [Pavlovales sp. CCMP2436]|nr:hypothetical protein T492DRAFT_994141 [Pavlovales sp. CCMP2436]
MQRRDFTSHTTTAATAGLSQRPAFAQRQDSPFLATTAATGGLSQPTSAQRIGLNLLDRRATAPIVGEPSYENGTPHASPAIRTPVLEPPWAPVLGTRPAARARPSRIPTPAATPTATATPDRIGSLLGVGPVTVNGIAGGMPILGSPTQIDQSDSRKKAATSLLTLIPVSAASLILGYNTQDTSIPKEWGVDLASFIASWSDSSISQCSLALRELNHFLNKSAGTPFDVPPVQLRTFLVEAALRGTSVPRSRLDGLCFAVNHLRITEIPVKAEIVTICPTGATWPTVQMVLHLERIAASEHHFPVVRYYAATLSLCCFQSLRGLLGTAWALPIEKAWGTQSPSDLCSIGVDFLFPALDSYSMLGEPRLSCPIKKAEHQEIERAMRALLAFNPLRMPRSQSQKFTGHSLRHFMTELGGAMLMDPADRSALGRHSAVTSRANGAAAGQAVPAIVQIYARESAPRCEISLRKFVLDHVRRVITSGGGRTAARWDSLDEFGLDPGALHPLILAIAMGAGVPATSLISHLTAATRGPLATLTATTIPTPDPRVPSRTTGSMIEWRNPA